MPERDQCGLRNGRRDELGAMPSRQNLTRIDTKRSTLRHVFTTRAGDRTPSIAADRLPTPLHLLDITAVRPLTHDKSLSLMCFGVRKISPRRGERGASGRCGGRHGVLSDFVVLVLADPRKTDDEYDVRVRVRFGPGTRDFCFRAVPLPNQASVTFRAQKCDARRARDCRKCSGGKE